MNTIHVLIIEDNSIIAESLSAMLKKQNFFVAGICPSGEEAILQLQTSVPDLILMDIRLSGKLDGIETALIISKSHAIPIIYLSDFTDAATVTRAKHTLPANFLSKPFHEADLVRAIEIAFHNASAGAAGQKKYEREKFLFLKTNDLFVKLTYNEILYLKADRAYSEVVTDNKTYKLSKSMNHIHELIDHPDFIRVSRSFVVNVNRITALDGNVIKIDDKTVQMTDDYRDSLLSRFKLIR